MYINRALKLNDLSPPQPIDQARLQLTTFFLSSNRHVWIETLDSSSYSPQKNVVQDNTRWSSTRETRVALISNTCDLCSHHVVLSLSLSLGPRFLSRFSNPFCTNFPPSSQKLRWTKSSRGAFFPSTIVVCSSRGWLLRWDPFTPRHSPCSAGVEFGSVFPELHELVGKGGAPKEGLHIGQLYSRLAGHTLDHGLVVRVWSSFFFVFLEEIPFELESDRVCKLEVVV